MISWGYSKVSSGTLSDKLLKATLPYRLLDCAEAYRRENITLMEETQFCAGDLENGDRGVCGGDMGSAAVVQGTKFYIFGIASFSKSCGGPQFASIFTKVGPYVRWINSVSGIYPLGI